MRQLKIGNDVIDDSTDAWVIAEVGHNHQGNLERCKDIFRAAKDCGVNSVKLQKRDNKTLFTKEFYDSAYNSENAFGATYGAHREALEFGKDEYVELQRFAAELGLQFFATAFDFRSADFLADLGVPAFKMASGDLRSIPLLTYVAKLGKPMIVSTGGANMEDVERAYDAIMPHNKQFALLQCTASYPCEPEHMNLKVVTSFRERFPDVVVGLSDHQSGIAMAPVAYALGARIIEKHFTLNRAWKGTDHAFSLEPVGLKKMVRDLQRARTALGDGQKRTYGLEEKPLMKMGKKIVPGRDLPAGHVLVEADLALRTPADGLSPQEWTRLIGRKTKRALKLDETMRLTDVE